MILWLRQLTTNRQTVSHVVGRYLFTDVYNRPVFIFLEAVLFSKILIDSEVKGRCSLNIWGGIL